MPRTSRSPAQRNSEPSSSGLAESVDRLTAEITTFCQILDDIRTEFSWVTRNGLPVQPIEHVHVKQMALDPMADDWGARLVIERSTFPATSSASPPELAVLDRIAEDLKSAFKAVAQGQLEVLLTALDGVRAEVLAALKHRRDDRSTIASATTIPPSSPDPPSRPPRGRLF